MGVLGCRIMKAIWRIIGLSVGLLIGVLLGWCYEAWAEEVGWNAPSIYIRAINPGYTVDNKSNVGEMIELARRDSDEPISLADITVSYTNTSGNTQILVEFPEYSLMFGTHQPTI